MYCNNLSDTKKQSVFTFQKQCHRAVYKKNVTVFINGVCWHTSIAFRLQKACLLLDLTKAVSSVVSRE
jgi:hypothetical protein